MLNNISMGDFEQKVNVYSNDEIGELTTAIDRAVVTLKDKIIQLQWENSQLQAILNSTIEGVIAIDKDRKIISINPAVERIFNVSKKEAIGKFLLEVIRNNDIFEVINIVLNKGEFISQELNLLWPIRKIFMVSASPIFEDSVISGCVVVIYDISEIRKLEEMRSEFIANVSHELKTPLTSIKGFVDTLLEGAIQDKDNSRHFLEIIQDHSHRLNDLIDGLLELSCMESKGIKLEQEKINLKDLAEEVLEGFSSQLKKRNITLQNGLPIDILLTADRKRLHTVLTNLIGNAIKFNKDNGLIKIYSENLDKEIKVIIEDSGIGIPQVYITRVFERFFRVDKGRPRNTGGTGLGLSIVKHIIELHKGRVGADSTEGIGSRFWFTLPK